MQKHSRAFKNLPTFVVFFNYDRNHKSLSASMFIAKVLLESTLGIAGVWCDTCWRQIDDTCAIISIQCRPQPIRMVLQLPLEPYLVDPPDHKSRS